MLKDRAMTKPEEDDDTIPSLPEFPMPIPNPPKLVVSTQ